MTPSMTPREKAEQLLHEYWLLDSDSCMSLFIDKSIARQCALITVDHMLLNDGWSSSREEWNKFKEYFEQVKQEIELL